MTDMLEPTADHRWRHTHMGNLMSRSLDRFDARVLTLMSRNEAVPLSLSNLAARGQLTAAHVQITRPLPVEGTRLTDLAARAGVTKQAMGKLVDPINFFGGNHEPNQSRKCKYPFIQHPAGGTSIRLAYHNPMSAGYLSFVEFCISWHHIE